MPNIQVLDPHVADLIAAGEVVERPASVVKELMENAFDAGAGSVTVEIAKGGMALIRVTDDGCGIPADQVQTAFLRHATSKLRQASDLEAIGTLGFRGEALAAISAVSRVELLTRTGGEALGTALTLEGGTVTEREEAGCPQGTTMIVRDLFFNTPARLKFMKRDQAEGAAVFAVVQREALAHPEVSVKFFRDGRQDLLTPGDGQLKSAIYAVLGRDMALGFIPVKGSGEGVRVEGYVSLPVCCRGSRNYQHFFVNGRYVKSLTMQTAVEEAYKNQKMVGKFPGCVLHLATKLNAVDVNVHPTKTEVKFSGETQVFSAVYHTVLDTLNADRSRPAAGLASPAPARSPFQAVGSSRDMSVRDPGTASALLGRTEAPTPPLQRRSAGPATPGAAPRVRFIPAGRAVDITPPERDFDIPAGERRSLVGEEQALPPVEGEQAPSLVGGEQAPSLVEGEQAPSLVEGEQAPPFIEGEQAPSLVGGERAPSSIVEERTLSLVEGERTLPPIEGEQTPSLVEGERTLSPIEGEQALPLIEGERAPSPIEGEQSLPQPDPDLVLPLPEVDWRMRGELFHTYILVEQGEKVLLIDKHAAHERMNFDRLRDADWRPMVQQLLMPVVITSAPEEKAALLAQRELLEEFGFSVEDFGASALAVSEAPEDIPTGEIAATLEELARRLLTAGSPDPAGARDELLHTMACKAAIKGGWKSAQEELLAVAEAVMSGRVKYCPHGRPVAVEMSRKQLEKLFKRG